MSKDLIKIRNPSVYHGGSVVPRNRTPFEKADGSFCHYRNATTTPYQTYSPYNSTVSNLSDLVDTDSIKCYQEGVHESRDIYKCHEDIYGNTYLLFKNDVPDTITSKRNTLGTLHIIGADGVEFDERFGTLVIPQGETVRDIQVFYDKVLIITDSRIWLGEAGPRNFFEIGYDQHFQTFFKDGVVYILHDFGGGEFEITKFVDGDLVRVTKYPLSDKITSSSMVVKDNRIEVVYNDTSSIGGMVVCEYDLINDKWDGYNLMDMPYEIVAVHDDSQSWYIYYESGTFPNRVGGIRIDFNVITPEVIAEEVCGTTKDLFFTIGSTECPTVSWLLESTNTNDWVAHTTHHVELRVQASAGECGGSNEDIQTGSAIGTIIVPVGKQVSLGWSMVAIVEEEDAGFDFAEYSVDGNVIAAIHSEGSTGGCSVLERTETGTTILAAGTHSLKVYYDTVDAAFHTDEFGVEFNITSCDVTDA